MNVIEQLQRFVAPINRRIANMLARAVLQAIDDAAPVQRVRAGLGQSDLRDGVERLQEFGFSSVPAPDDELFVAFVGGDRAHPVVLKANARAGRPMGKPVDTVVVWNRAGCAIELRPDGTIHFKAPRLYLDGDAIVLRAKERLRLDVGGLAEETRVDGGGWAREAWDQGAVVAPVGPNPPAPPETEAP